MSISLCLVVLHFILKRSRLHIKFISSLVKMRMLFAHQEVFQQQIIRVRLRCGRGPKIRGILRRARLLLITKPFILYYTALTSSLSHVVKHCQGSWKIVNTDRSCALCLLWNVQIFLLRWLHHSQDLTGIFNIVLHCCLKIHHCSTPLSPRIIFQTGASKSSITWLARCHLCPVKSHIVVLLVRT